jgi:hypothetical protein
MAKVTYTPVADHGDDGETRQAGYHFQKGKSVEVKDESVLATLRGNPNFTVAGEKGQAATAKDDRHVNPEPGPAPSIANMVYPNQPPGVGSKTAAIPRPEGSVEGAIEAHGGDLKAAAEATQQSAEALQASADRLAEAQKTSEPRAPKKPRRASGSKKASKSKRK